MSHGVPAATYRLQFNPEFGFRDGEHIVEYLAALGIGSIYASPSFAARRGSQHGYDVAEPSRFSRELGGEEAFLDLSRSLKRHGMGILLDIVPNHMAASTENPWWRDLLANGRDSRYAEFFDVDWDPSTSKGTLHDRLLLPVLGAPFGTALENQEIAIRFGKRGFTINYYDLSLPVRVQSYPLILGAWDDDPAVDISPAAAAELRTAISDAQAERQHLDPDQNESVRRTLISIIERLLSEFASFGTSLESRLEKLNGTKGDPDSFNELESILVRQVYRLAYWRRAADEVNYRRFFDITDLVGVRVEKDEVFLSQHERIFQLVEAGHVTGLRIDHIDGLYDPVDYLRKLQLSVAPGWNGDAHDLDFSVVVEKILAQDENLPDDFATDGTSGYDFLNVLNNLFIDPEGLKRLDGTYRRFTGIEQSFEELAYGNKAKILGDLFWGDVRRLGDDLIRLALQDRHARDIRPREVSEALFEVTSRMPVYRTYVRDRGISEQDRRFVEQALERASTQSTAQSGALDFLRRVLLMEIPLNQIAQEPQWLEFVMRWQQFTGRVMAKGVEDTSFYVFNRLISMNEVGGEPGVEVAFADRDFHRFNSDAAERWPYGLNATSTHDTKRSEDVRARIDALSEFASEWEQALEQWSELNQAFKGTVRGAMAPDRNEEIMLYQSLLGVWPDREENVATLPERVEQYIVKALREAKTHSSWHWPDEQYEQAVIEFAKRIITDPHPQFRQSFSELHSQLALLGASNSLGQVALKITAPGIPDFYQGSELWDLSLVDPDNRRPVDYELRERFAEALRSDGRGSLELSRQLSQEWQDGRIKLFLTLRALAFRQNHAGLFNSGEYLPLSCEGPRSRHLVAFCRRHGAAWSVTVVPRWMRGLISPRSLTAPSPIWEGTTLLLPGPAPSEWKNIFTGETCVKESTGLALGTILGSFPIAILEGSSSSDGARPK
ncbi:MAG: malto-oligosyltrehalose synthase [Acidobacteriota bacterium]